MKLHLRLKGNYAALSRQKFSSNVVEKCLRVGDSNWRAGIVSELMADDNTVAMLLQDSYGNYVMQNALYVAESPQVQELVEMIRPRLQLLRKNINLGRIISTNS